MEALEEEKENWKLDFVNLGYSLPLWDRALPLEDACVHVDWAEGRRLAQSVGVRGNELHFWEQREPEVEAVAEEAAEGDIQTEEDFQQMEDMASSLEQLLHQEAEIRGKIDAASQLEDKKFTFWFWLGILSMAGAAAGIASFYMAMAGTAALYGAAGGLMLGILCFLFNNKSIHKKGNDLEKWNDSLASLLNERKAISDKFPGQAPEDIDDLQAFHNLMQSRRSDFYKDQAKRQAISWKRETVRKQQLAHQKWTEEGKLLREKKEKADKDWDAFLAKNKLPKTSAENLSALQEQWQKIYSAEGKGKILDLRLEQMDARLDAYSRRAESIISKTKMPYTVDPDGIQELYEETHARSLTWQSIQEKNNQHDAYRKEMDKLDDGWASCQREMDTLLHLVNAKNAEEFAEKVNAHEHHDQLTKEWEAVKQDLRLYAGSDEEFQSLWNFLESGQYDDWMETHHNLEKRIKEETASLGELQKNQGAVENEIFRLAGDNTITDTAEKRKDRSRACQCTLRMADLHVYRRNPEPRAGRL